MTYFADEKQCWLKFKLFVLVEENKRGKEKRGNGTHETWRGIVCTNGAGCLLQVSGSVRGAPIPYLQSFPGAGAGKLGRQVLLGRLRLLAAISTETVITLWCLTAGE